MALGMKQWLGLVLAGCALVAIESLPPRSVEYGGIPTPPATRRRVEELGADVRGTAGLYQRLRWADSLPALLAADARDGVAVGGPPELPERILAGLRGRVMQARSRARTVDPDLLFGYYVQYADQSAARGDPGTWFSRTSPETMAGTVDGKPYCAEVALVGRRYLKSHLERPELFFGPYSAPSRYGPLGACRPFVQFGLPGPRIAAWLKRGGIAFAEADAAAGRDDHGPMDFTESRRETPWSFQWTIPGVNLPLDRCLAGRATACLQLALHGRPDRAEWQAPIADSVDAFIVDHSPFYRVQDVSTKTVFGYSGRYVLADLEREFGPRAFRRFWTSDEEVPRAFRDAFGVDMGQWLVRWTRANTYTYRAGPSLPRSAALGGFALLVLCGVIAGAWATKRSVA